MKYLNVLMGSILLFLAIVTKDQTSQGLLYSGSAINFCVAIMSKDENKK